MNPAIQSEILKRMAALSPNRVNLGEEGFVMERPRYFGIPQMQTDGEQRRWLNPLKEEAVIMGGKCPKCGQIYAPMFLERCSNPECRLPELKPIILPDVGHVFEAEPAVVIFPPMNFHGLAPYGHAHVILSDGKVIANTAMVMLVRSRKGPVREGIFGPTEPVKVVFKRQRDGWITDVVCLPQSELTEEQIAKSPLFLDEIDWTELKEKPVFEKNEEYAEAFPGIIEAMSSFCLAVNSAGKAKEILGRRDFTINIFTSGGNFCLVVKDGEISVSTELVENPTTEFAIENPQVFLAWTTGAGISEAIASGELWFHVRSQEEGGQFELDMIFNLDRIYRKTVKAKTA